MDRFDDDYYDTDDLLSLREKIVSYIRKHNITCPESIYQRDDIVISATSFIQDIIESSCIGYLESDYDYDDDYDDDEWSTGV